MAMFSCLPALNVGKKKKSMKYFKAGDDGKKGSSYGDLRVNPADLFSSSTENGFKEHHLTVSKPFSFAENESPIIPKVPSDESLALDESIGEAAYEGGDEFDEFRSMKRENSDFDLQPNGDLASHGSNTDLKHHFFEETDKEPGFLESNHLPGNCRVHITCDNYSSALPIESSHMDRVNSWVNSLDDCSLDDVDVEEYCCGVEDEQIADSHCLKIVESSKPACSNNIFQSLNAFSSVAYMAGNGLNIIPSISAFSSLRSVNLSGNCIVKITPGSLPKSLHMLDLSRNKISTIEGLRDLEKLRVLNLSYNRIARIGHGLSNCTIIKELYLAGNKISNVEGLHRLLKLAVLDLSLNKIITAKALGQLVANYNTLVAVNLLGNPIQANVGDNELKKAVLSLLPNVTYLNKQLLKPQRVGEVVNECVAKVAIGDAAWSSKRKPARRLKPGLGSSLNRVGEGSLKASSFRTIQHGKGKNSTSSKKKLSEASKDVQ